MCFAIVPVGSRESFRNTNDAYVDLYVTARKLLTFFKRALVFEVVTIVFLYLPLLCISAMPCVSQADELPRDTVDSSDMLEIQRLGDPSHARRMLAKERLRQRGIYAEEALRYGLNSDQLEIRITASELLEELKAIRLESAIQTFLQGNAHVDNELLPSWKFMKEVAGDSSETRKLFASILPRFSTSLRWLDSLSTESATQLEIETTGVDTYLPIDLKQLNEGDTGRWALILLAASHDSLKSLPILNSRIRGSLLHENVACRLQASPYAPVLRNLISHWLKESSEAYINASMLKIAIRYQCELTAIEMSESILRNPRSSPYAVSTSLILVARLCPERAIESLPEWFDDARTCHVWQIVNGNKNVIQTEIGDVAIALALYLRGHDPRVVGFKNIEADPHLIYREFSMGFDNRETRRNVKQKAIQILAGSEIVTLAQ